MKKICIGLKVLVVVLAGTVSINIMPAQAQTIFNKASKKIATYGKPIRPEQLPFHVVGNWIMNGNKRSGSSAKEQAKEVASKPKSEVKTNFSPRT